MKAKKVYLNYNSDKKYYYYTIYLEDNSKLYVSFEKITSANLNYVFKDSECGLPKEQPKDE